MSAVLWPRLPLWLGSYLVLAVGSNWIGAWVVTCLQGRPRPGWFWPTMGQGRATVLHAIALLTALLGGATVPLGAPLEWRGQSYGWHMLGEAEGGILIAATITWVAAGLLIASDSAGGAWSPPARQAAGPLLTCGAVSLLALPGLAIAASPLVERGGAGLSVASIIAAQQRWYGLGWLGISQPLAMLSWLGCTLTFHPAGQGQASLAWQLVIVNWALLTTASFLGGWQGPFAEGLAWLAYLYTAVKVAGLTALRAWAGARLPMEHPLRRARTAWTVYMPALLVNLVLTAGLTVLR